MNEKLIKNQRDIYREQLLAYGDSPDATYNQSESIQQLRFARLLNALDLNHGVSVHDVGCGICDLYPYLKKRFPSVHYSGTEIVPEMSELATSKYPEVTVLIRDIVTSEITGRYDYVVLSGVFNLPGESPREEWKSFTRILLTRMFDLCTKGIAFNFLNASAAEYHHPDMHYESPEEISLFCTSNFSRFIYVDQSYPLFECTTTVLRPEYVEEMYFDTALQRYIK
jgi:cyclopropane fatty-acyl-phospholipid synthase-like methyltransferase